MSRRPEHDPLGAKPVLPAPKGPGAERARRVFESYVKRLREGASVDELTAQGPIDPGPPPPPTRAEPQPSPAVADTGGRRYDVALSKVMGTAPEAEETAAAALETDSLAPELAEEPPDADLPLPPIAEPEPGVPTFVPVPIDEENTQPRARPERPPPGAPTIRPPVVRKSDPATVPQELLEGTADSAMLVSDPDGSTSFDIAFNDDTFPNLACRITIVDGKVIATFRVEDQNLRRLLEAEAGRLRASLEDRGLKVAEVRVEVG